jgi:hypothetical protein
MDIAAQILLGIGATFILALVLLVVLFTAKFFLIEVKAPPDQVLAYLAHSLRTRRYHVEEKPGHLNVHIGSSYAVKIFARGTSQQAKLYYTASATSSGWGTMLIFLIMGAAIIAIPIFLWYFTRARRFARKDLLSLIPSDGIPAPPRSDDVRTLIINGLSEEHRYVTEATKATEVLYTDGLVVILLSGLLIWSLSTIYFYDLFSSYEIFVRVVYSALFGGLVAIPFFVVASYLAVRRFSPQLKRFSYWNNRLSETLDFEILHIRPGDEKRSTFEILFEGSKEVPIWIDAKRKSGFSRNPIVSYVLFGLAMVCFYLLFFAVMGVSYLGLEVYIQGILGGLLGSLLIVAHVVWSIKGKQEAARAMAQWDARFGELRTRMERFLQEL